MNRRIEKRKYFAIVVRLRSPLLVSSGENRFSDADVLRNGLGEIFVPGTSLAGAFRNHMELDGYADKIMGFSEGNKGCMSSLYISDLYFQQDTDSELKISIRDRVQLNGKKTVENKFDTELVEPGVCGTLFLNYIQRQDDSADYETAVSVLLQEIESGAIRFGANKNRGFGRFHVLKVFEREFTSENVDGWIHFSPHSKELASYEEGRNYKDWVVDKKKATSHYLKIQVPLRLMGGISIRRYSTRPDMPDFEHITCGKDGEGNPIPIIPGTSWSGAIRRDAFSKLTKLVGEKKAEEYVQGWFGHVAVKKKTGEEELDAWQSSVVVGESQLQGGTWLSMTRNQINRFDASTKAGALYSEWSYFGGVTNLELMVQKEGEFEALIGLLLLIIDDLQKGYLCVGGQVAVGRGIFEKEGEVRFSESIDLEKCNSALYEFLYEQEVE